MTQPQADPSPPEFAVAWSALAEAEQARVELLSGWRSLGSEDPFSVDVVTRQDGFGRIDVSCWWPPALARDLDQAALRFAESIKSSMDEAVLAAAQFVCRALGDLDRERHYMPLCHREEDFDSIVPDGDLLGLRPDQVHVLRQLQPFSSGDRGAQFVGSRMLQLSSMLSPRPVSKRRLAIWASSARPQVVVRGDATVSDIRAEDDGLLDPVRTVGTYRIDTPGRATVSANPNVGFDLVFNDPPWPTDPDDNIGARTNDLIVIARHLIEALQASVSQPSLLSLVGSLDDYAPAVPRQAWMPVHFDDDSVRLEAQEAITRSDLMLATYRDDAGSLTLLTVIDGRLVGRTVPEASVINPAKPLGTATEDATLAIASKAGVPDFVYRPKVLLKGSGRREIGDGTIIAGPRGISLQVKARESPTDNAFRERSWLIKKGLAASRQAAGTVRTSLNVPAVELTNERGREVQLDGSAIDWAAVVVLDHPAPPSDVIVAAARRVPTLVVLRRDWDFLWDQLRSASAIVDYVHRVAGSEPIELGTEAVRYFDLAHADANAPPHALEPWMSSWGATSYDGPQLPPDPVASRDEPGHAVFRAILNDIARSPFSGDEGVRLQTLALIDRFSVGHRAELGRLLLRRLDQCLLTPPDQTRWEHRTVLMDHGRLHLAFSVCSILTGYHSRMFTDWLLLRRSEMLQLSRPDPSDLPVSVGVLLTPRPGGDRFWDTTIVATNAPVELDPDYLRVLADLWSRDHANGSAIE